jgi:hypothetical protein
MLSCNSELNATSFSTEKIRRLSELLLQISIDSYKFYKSSDIFSY